MGRWGLEDQSSYGDAATSDQQYEEGANHGKDRPQEREWSDASEWRMTGRMVWPRYRNGHSEGSRMRMIWSERGIVTMIEIGKETVTKGGTESETETEGHIGRAIG
jgi:hypothetical protein